MLSDIEDRILHVLSSSKGSILEDATAVAVLGKSKTLSDDIAQKQAVAEKTSRQIDAARKEYSPMAKRAAAIYFCVADLAMVDPMYQYSLTWFGGLYELAMKEAETGSSVQKRVESLKETFTLIVYRNVCVSLFEKHKLLFSFVLGVAILNTSVKEELRINQLNGNFFLLGARVVTVTLSSIGFQSVHGPIL